MKRRGGASIRIVSVRTEQDTERFPTGLKPGQKDAGVRGVKRGQDPPLPERVKREKPPGGGAKRDRNTPLPVRVGRGEAAAREVKRG